MQSGIKQWVVILKSDIDILTSEKIIIPAELAGNEIRKTSFIKVLSNLTGLENWTQQQYSLCLCLKDELSNELHTRPELQLLGSEKGTARRPG